MIYTESVYIVCIYTLYIQNVQFSYTCVYIHIYRFFENFIYSVYIHYIYKNCIYHIYTMLISRNLNLTIVEHCSFDAQCCIYTCIYTKTQNFIYTVYIHIYSLFSKFIYSVYIQYI